MNTTLAILAALAALTVWASAAPASPPAQGGYTTKFDNINLDEILGNDRLFNKYLECLLAQTDARCTGDGKELRKAIPDALTNECSKCNDKQRAGAEKVIRHLLDNRRDDWTKLEAKYDPQGVYHKRYEARAAQHGVHI